MLKFLTSKFRNQSLNEVKPYDPQVTLRDELVSKDVENTEEEDEELKNITEDPRNINNNVTQDSNSRFGAGIALVESKENIPLQQDHKLPVESENHSLNKNTSMTRQRDCNSAEKRKWSQVNAHKLLLQFASNGAETCSSDDEIKELCSQQSNSVFLSSSPPIKVTKVAVLAKNSAFPARVRPTEGHTRKKHRLAEEDSQRRPSLNFEKMQQKAFFRKHNQSMSRPRVVRIKNITSSGLRPPTGSYNPSVLSFRPINFNTTLNLAPVEEPNFVF